MKITTIIRALKDARFRSTLTAEERAQLPAHPAGMIDLTPAQLEAVAGARPIASGTTTCGTSTCDIQCK
jgi:mersacidin/lichenicidin family type 2 lantibiotic